MTDEQINEIASSYMEMNADMYVSFLPSNLDKFARAVEQASRRAVTTESIEATSALIANSLLGAAPEEDVREVGRLINEMLGRT